MPYFHSDCDGQITFLARKCRKCGKQWPLNVLWAWSPPQDMYYIVNEPPRWLKVVVRLAILGVAAGILLSMIIFFGVSLSGIVGLLLVTAIIFGMTFINRRRNKRG